MRLSISSTALHHFSNQILHEVDDLMRLSISSTALDRASCLLSLSLLIDSTLLLLASMTCASFSL